MTYDNTNKGALFNAKEVKTDKHPVMTGKLNVEGKDWHIAGWKAESKKGEKYLSLKVSEPREKQDDGLPF
tara:strand:+ start:3007 stop:3216 length:210 start_codon:yes stop_codon:yes gene_type:complete